MVVSLLLMTKEAKYLIVDAGNTRIKVAHYQGEELLNLSVLEKSDFHRFGEIISGLTYESSILSSVRSEKESFEMYGAMKNCILLKEAKLPLKMGYRSPETLGSDRIANAVAIAHLSKTAAISIDLGTCIKFDFVDAENCYQGGSISPGIKLRYRSLHAYTAALPLLDNTDAEDLTGKDTAASIRSGVINGIQGEIQHFINAYSSQYPDLTIFVTGGDAQYFDYSSKNSIFADQNLTIYGLLLILRANAK